MKANPTADFLHEEFEFKFITPRQWKDYIHQDVLIWDPPTNRLVVARIVPYGDEGSGLCTPEFLTRKEMAGLSSPSSHSFLIKPKKNIEEAQLLVKEYQSRQAQTQFDEELREKYFRDLEENPHESKK